VLDVAQVVKQQKMSWEAKQARGKFYVSGCSRCLLACLPWLHHLLTAVPMRACSQAMSYKKILYKQMLLNGSFSMVLDS